MASRVGRRPPATGATLHNSGELPCVRAIPPGLSTSPARRWPSTRPSGGKPGSPPLTTTIGRALVACGRPAEAINEHRHGLQRAVAFGFHRAVTKALEGLAEAMAEAGDLDRAAEVLGTAGALRQDSATPANPTQQRAVSSLVASLRDRLGADAVEAARRRGQRRPVAELVDGAEKRRLTNGLQLELEIDDPLDECPTVGKGDVPAESPRLPVDRGSAGEHAPRCARLVDGRAAEIDLDVDLVGGTDDREPPAKPRQPAGRAGARRTERCRRVPPRRAARPRVGRSPPGRTRSRR